MLARVAVDMPLPHLDRFWDYFVPEEMEADAKPGVRVRVRFHGRVCNGYIVENPLVAEVDKLSPLLKVVSPEPVLLGDQVALIRAVADRYAGTFADVMRLVVPPRHAATEAAARTTWPEPITDAMPPGGLNTTQAGAAWLREVAGGRPLRAFWAVPPVFGQGWQVGVVQAVVACLRSGKNAIVATPDADDTEVAYKALSAVVGLGTVARLLSNMGPAARYREYLAVARGQARVVVGTRPCVYAPMDNLGLIVLVDEGNDLYFDPRAPYPNSRTTAVIRAGQAKCGLLLAGTARSCEVQQWIASRWLGVIEQAPEQRRSSTPAIRVVAEVGASAKFIRAGLQDGPVLVQVARAGYLVALTCENCRTRVTCPACHGPVEGQRGGDGGRYLACRWCGQIITGWKCPECGGTMLRAPVVGSGRTAEELGRAFPGFRVIDSSGGHVVARVGEQPALVVATAGAEPLPDAGYSAAVILDADRMLMMPEMRAPEEAVRRWFRATSLVRVDGTVCVVGSLGASAIQALLRADPGGFAARELAQRREAGLPPARTFVVATGEAPVLASMAGLVGSEYEMFGPVDVGPTGEAPQQRLIWRCEQAEASEMIAAIKSALAVRSATKLPGLVRVQVDPYTVV